MPLVGLSYNIPNVIIIIIFNSEHSFEVYIGVYAAHGITDLLLLLNILCIPSYTSLPPKLHFLL